jgi:GSCFA family
MKYLNKGGAGETVAFEPEGQAKKRMDSSFFRGATVNFNPYRRDFAAPEFLSRFVLKGWLPDNKPIDKTTNITAFGSCFAQNISKHLSEAGFKLTKDTAPDIYVSYMGEGLVNVHALCQQFEWALENKKIPEGLWHGWTAEEYGVSEDIRLATQKAFLNTDFFIVTLGLSEVWYDEPTGEVFWRAVPVGRYEAARHRFRVCSHAETKERIEKIYALIRTHVPKAKVLFTLSPIPLAATFRDVSCLSANSVSKAILRAALDEFLREHSEDLNTRLLYFPSYEIVNELFHAKYMEDGRHPSGDIIGLIMKIFQAAYCDTDLRLEEVEQAYQAARVKNMRDAINALGG